MSTFELDRRLSAAQHDSASAHLSPSSEDDPNLQKRRCIAALMDRYPDTFAAPTSAPSWNDFVEQNCVPSDAEQLTLNMAIGRLVQVMRVAQEGIPEPADLPTLLQRAEQEGVGDIEPDNAVQSLASPDAAPEEVHVMARAMSLYKTCMANGVAQGDEITNAIDAGFHHVPVTSPFMQSLVDTAKEVTLIDVRYALNSAVGDALMNPLDFPARLVLPSPAQTDSLRPAGSAGGGASFAQAMADVSSIARDITSERVSIANQMRRIVKGGDTSQIPQVLTRLQDANAMQDIMSTVLTKTTSGIDQIVKMQ